MKHTPLPEAVRGLVRWLLFLTLFLIGVASASAHYDPRLGRWLSRDPLGEEGGVNLYAYCGNDPVNRHDPTGLAELDPGAPSNEQITNRLLNITAELELLQESALARNAVDCIGWRPPQFVNSGAAGVALRSEQQFLNRVLKVRGEIGPNGYGTWSTHSALSREFGWYGEDVRSFFVPQGGYMASTAIRKNLDYAQNATWWSLNLASMAIPLPLPRGGGAVNAGSRGGMVEGRLGPVIDMVPGPNGGLIPAFEARTLALTGADSRLLLTPGNPTTRTLAQVRALRGEARWRAGEEYVQQLYGSPGQQHFPVPTTGGRFVDAPVPVPGGVLANEVKTYQTWRTVAGVPQQQVVPLSNPIRQQILRDVYLRGNVPGYDPRWLFLDAPPGPDLAGFLTDRGIPFIIYH